MHVILAAVIFAATWLLWSGHYSPLLLGLGAGSCLLVLCLAGRTGFFDLQTDVLRIGSRLPRFWCWLLKEIARANFAVARIVLSRHMPIEPTVVVIDARHLPPVSLVTLANAITLTPGTLSLDVDRGQIEVHCLTRDAADDLRGGEMIRRATALAES
ncbi:MAG TPA: Na+/H+ antiporter subunit E [Gammaproteobacteria bacterium]|nr:Na+/H+ antiporter subunit E [Gammaproteobacteria bacterium]